MNFLLRLMFLWPFALLFVGVTEFRRFLYRFVISPTKVDAFVISVGNITSGGTGKTPFVDRLIQILLKKGKRVAVVSRNYKAGVKVATRIDLANPDPALYGDEPSMLAKRFPQVPVYVGPKKLESAQAVVKYEKPDVIIVDDGFQHLRLKRDLDIIIIDATQPLWQYLPLPIGFGRDALWRTERADLVVVTKENLVDPNQRKSIAVLLSERQHPVRMDYTLRCFLDVNEKTEYPINTFDGQGVLLVSGIGRPPTFEAMIRAETSVRVMGHMAFPDHHNYTAQDLRRIERRARELNAEAVVMTEKDAVKLSGRLGVSAFAALLDLGIYGLEERLDEVLVGRLR